MAIVEYVTSWDYAIQHGEATASGPVHTLRLTSSVNTDQTIEQTDTEANAIISAVNSIIPTLGQVEGAGGTYSTLDGVRRDWTLGQVGEIGN